MCELRIGISVLCREAREQSEVNKYRSERPKIQQLFSDLKKGPSHVPHPYSGDNLVGIGAREWVHVLNGLIPKGAGNMAEKDGVLVETLSSSTSTDFAP